jgi:hypothetical protein
MGRKMCPLPTGIVFEVPDEFSKQEIEEQTGCAWAKIL